MPRASRNVLNRREEVQYGALLNAKQEAGLGEYQGRSWPGFHHHLAMVWLALTWLHLYRRPLPPPEHPAISIAPSPPSTDPGAPSSPRLYLRLLAGLVSVLPAARAPAALPLPRQIWESVQDVRRRLMAWFRAVIHLELLLAGVRPAIPLLGPLPSGP